MKVKIKFSRLKMKIKSPRLLSNTTKIEDFKNSRKSASAVKGVFGNILFNIQNEDLYAETSMLSSQACLGEDCWDKSFRRVSH